MAKCLYDKGTFDEECEAELSNYRRQREALRLLPEVNARAATTITAATTTNPQRSRSYSTALTTTTTQGGGVGGGGSNNNVENFGRFLNCPSAGYPLSASPTYSSASCSTSTTYVSQQQQQQQQQNQSTTTMTTLLPDGVPESGFRKNPTKTNGKIDEFVECTFDFRKEDEEVVDDADALFGTRKSIERKCRFASEKVLERHRHPFSPKPQPKREMSQKARKLVSAEVDQLFVQLGEILAHQFHSTITIESCGASQHRKREGAARKRQTESDTHQQHNFEESENVHERELKVLIWRHFVQMLVAVLTDRARFSV